jgi:hypothetical protein
MFVVMTVAVILVVVVVAAVVAYPNTGSEGGVVAITCEAMCRTESAGNYVRDRSTYQRSAVGYSIKPKHLHRVRMSSHVFFFCRK